MLATVNDASTSGGAILVAAGPLPASCWKSGEVSAIPCAGSSMRPIAATTIWRSAGKMVDTSSHKRQTGN